VMHTYMYQHPHTRTHPYTHTYSCHTHAHTHTRTHTACPLTTPTQHTHTHKHTHCRCCHTPMPVENFQVSFVEYRLFYRALLQNRPIILRRSPQLPPKASCRLQPAHPHWTHPPPPCLRSAHFRARHDFQAAQVHTQWEFLKISLYSPLLW